MKPSDQIFLTGATGFIGAELARYYAAGPRSLLASSRSASPAGLPKQLAYLQADIQVPLPRQKAGAVIHTAALASDAASWADLKRANLDGVRNVYEACRECRCFIFISSSSVYNLGQTPHEENEPVDPAKLSPYGRSKRLAEEWLLQQDWSERALYILRPRAVYGIGDRLLLPRLMRMVRGNYLIAPGAMRVQSSLTHVSHLCDVTDLCLRQATTGIHVFNVADAHPYDMRTLVHRLLSEIYGRELRLHSLPIGLLRNMAALLEKTGWSSPFTPFALSAVSNDNVLSLTKIQQVLGYTNQRSFWAFLPELSAWVKRAGLERVKNADPFLPFIR